MDLLGEYNVNATFNVSDLSLFDIDNDSRLSPFKERKDDIYQPTNLKDWPEVLIGHWMGLLSLFGVR